MSLHAAGTPCAGTTSRFEADRRSAPRVAVRVEAEICLTSIGRVRSRTREVSVSGTCVETPSPIPPASICGVVLHLPDAGPLTLRAGFGWQREAETGILTGIRFLAPDRATLEHLWSFVNKRAMEIGRFLGEITELAGLAMDETLDLALSSRLREVPGSTWLYGQGTSLRGQDSIFCIVEGRVALEAAVRCQHEVLLDQIGPGRLFGGLPLVAAIPHVESAIAETECELLEFDRVAFEYLRTAKPAVAHRLVQAVMLRQAWHLKDVIRRLSALKAPPPRPRCRGLGRGSAAGPGKANVARPDRSFARLRLAARDEACGSAGSVALAHRVSHEPSKEPR